MVSALAEAMEPGPRIERVHGTHHSELTRIRELTVEISGSTNDAASADKEHTQ